MQPQPLQCLPEQESLNSVVGSGKHAYKGVRACHDSVMKCLHHIALPGADVSLQALPEARLKSSPQPVLLREYHKP